MHVPGRDAELTQRSLVAVRHVAHDFDAGSRRPETERLIQELASCVARVFVELTRRSYEIDTHAIVVNQLLFPLKESTCEHCATRFKMQGKYLVRTDASGLTDSAERVQRGALAYVDRQRLTA